MKAILVREFGAPEVMKLEEVPTPRAGAGQVLVAPLLQRAEDHLELPAGRGEPVREAGPGTGLAVRLAGHDTELDQGGQPIRQDVGGHAQPVAEFSEPGRAQESLAQDQERPALPDYAQGPRDRARILRVLRHASSIPAELVFWIQPC